MNGPRLLARAALLGLDLSLLGLGLALIRLLAPSRMVTLTLPGLAVALLAGTAAAVLTGRWETTRRPRLPGVLVLMGVDLLLVKGGLGGGYSLAGGWDVLIGALQGHSSAGFGATYLALLLALGTSWRGTRLLVPTVPAEVQQRFKRGLLVLVALLAGAALVPVADPGRARQAGILATIVYVASGLLAQALFREMSAERGDTRLAPRKLLLLFAAIGVPLALALLLASAFSADTAALIARAYTTLVQAIVFVITPILVVLFSILEGLVRLLRGAVGRTPLSPLPTPVPPPALPPSAPGTPVGVPAWLGALVRLLAYLIPVLLIALLVLRRSRRSRIEDVSAEERESVWSWDGAGRDLQSWWQQVRSRLARPEGDALAAALARLRGDDPVTLIRRTYVRLLIRSAQADRGRAPDQTPAEYARMLAPTFAGKPDALQVLTRSYEQARYHPTATTAADAAAAVRAWEQLADAIPQPPKDGDEATR